mgnify:CR=1 FL=1
MGRFIFNNGDEVPITDLIYRGGSFKIIIPIENADDFIDLLSDDFSGKIIIFYSDDYHMKRNLVCEDFQLIRSSYDDKNVGHILYVEKKYIDTISTINGIEGHMPWTVTIECVNKVFNEFHEIIRKIKNNYNIEFKNDSIIAKSWIEMVRSKEFKLSQVPCIGNLKTVVSSALDEQKSILSIQNIYAGLKYGTAEHVCTDVPGY